MHKAECAFEDAGGLAMLLPFFPYKVHLINHDMAARVIQKHHHVASAVILAERRKKTILLYINIFLWT